MENENINELAVLRPKLLSLAQRFVRASGLQRDPEDLVQEVLLRLWMALKGGAEIRSQESWAVTVLKNLCVSLWRKNKAPAPLPDSLLSADTASDRVETADSRKQLRQALEHIPVATRLLLQMRQAGMSLDEMATVTGRPKGSIKSSLSIARKQIWTFIAEL